MIGFALLEGICNPGITYFWVFIPVKLAFIEVGVMEEPGEGWVLPSIGSGKIITVSLYLLSLGNGWGGEASDTRSVSHIIMQFGRKESNLGLAR